MNEMLDFNLGKSSNYLVKEFKGSNIELFIKREDLLYPEVSGNKFRKLKYNLLQAKEENKEQLLTFGGAYSNHIAATAAAGKLFGFKTIGIIRGEELAADLQKTLAENATLRYAFSCGMQLEFVSRAQYSEKESSEFLELMRNNFGDCYVLPEGGTNVPAIRGCEEILTENDMDFDFVCCPVGTGGTISGIINSSRNHQEVLGFPALKGDFLKPEISKFTIKTNWELVENYHFGGYAKVSKQLVQFINEFSSKYKIQLDPIYTGKMFFGIMDMIEKSEFPQNSRILAIHTGGLQGIAGMNNLLIKKNLPQIQTLHEN